MNNIYDVLKEIGVFGLAMWFIQLLITKSTDKKFELYKMELEHKTREFQSSIDNKFENYKAKLNLNNYKSTKIYEKQLDAIIDLHRKLANLHMAMQAMTALFKQVVDTFEKDEEIKIKKVIDTYNDFLLFYEENKIFLPEKTIEGLDKIRNDYYSAFIDYTHGKQYVSIDIEARSSMRQANEKVNNEISPNLKLLIEDFRRLIGGDIA
jgi:hypothetical protein